MATWRAAESRIALETKGTLVRGSGRGIHKGDVITGTFLIEVKETSKDRFVLHMDQLLKLRQEASLEKRLPAMVIELGDRSRLLILFRRVVSAEGAQKSWSLRRGSIGETILSEHREWEILDGNNLDLLRDT